MAPVTPVTFLRKALLVASGWALILPCLAAETQDSSLPLLPVPAVYGPSLEDIHNANRWGEVYWGDDGRGALPRVPAPVSPNREPFDSDPETLDAAVYPDRLETLGPESGRDGVLIALAALTDPDGRTSRAAAEALTRFDPRQVAWSVLRVLCEGTDEAIAAVDRSLPELREHIEDPLRDVLRDSAAAREYRLAAAYSLGRMRSRAAVPLLFSLAWTDDADFVYYSVDALSAIADPGSYTQFVRFLEHPWPEVRWAAVNSIAAIGGDRARPALTQLALERCEPERAIRQLAVHWLGELGDASTIDVLMTILNTEPMLERDAAEALGVLTGLDLGPAPPVWRDWYARAQNPEGVPPPLVPAGEAAAPLPDDVPPIMPSADPFDAGAQEPIHVQQPTGRPAVSASEPGFSPLPEQPVIEMPQPQEPVPVVEAAPRPARSTPPPMNLPDDMPIQFRQAFEQLGDRMPRDVVE